MPKNEKMQEFIGGNNVFPHHVFSLSTGPILAFSLLLLRRNANDQQLFWRQNRGPGAITLSCIVHSEFCRSAWNDSTYLFNNTPEKNWRIMIKTLEMIPASASLVSCPQKPMVLLPKHFLSFPTFFILSLPHFSSQETELIRRKVRETEVGTIKVMAPDFQTFHRSADKKNWTRKLLNWPVGKLAKGVFSCLAFKPQSK